MTLNDETISTGLKVAPPVAIVAADTVAAVTLSDIVLYANLAYIILMAAYQIWKWRREHGMKRRFDDAE